MLPILRSIQNPVYLNIVDAQQQTPLLSNSLDHDYIPFFSIFRGEFKRIGDFRYGIYWIEPTYQISDIFRQANERMINHLKMGQRTFKYSRGNIDYYLSRHFIYTLVNDKPVILYSLLIDKEYYRTMSFDALDYSKFLIIINNEFTKAEHKSFFTYFKKTILGEHSEVPVDIVYTNDITRYCFKPIEIPLQFATIVEMRNYFSSVTQTVVNEFRG